MAREYESRNMKAVTILLTDEIISEVARIAKKRDMPKANVYRMMLELGIEMHKDMESVGIVAAVDFAYYCKEALKAMNNKVAKGAQLHLPI